MTAAMAVLAAVSGCAGTAEPSSGPASPTATSTLLSDPDRYARELEDGVDAARESFDQPALAHDECAERAALGRAEALVGADELEHAPLDDVLAACGAGRAGENLSRSARPASAVVAAWLDSAGHAANIRNDGYDRGAVACVRDAEATASPELVCSHVFLGP